MFPKFFCAAANATVIRSGIRLGSNETSLGGTTRMRTRNVSGVVFLRLWKLSYTLLINLFFLYCTFSYSDSWMPGTNLFSRSLTVARFQFRQGFSVSWRSKDGNFSKTLFEWNRNDTLKLNLLQIRENPRGQCCDDFVVYKNRTDEKELFLFSDFPTLVEKKYAHGTWPEPIVYTQNSAPWWIRSRKRQQLKRDDARIFFSCTTIIDLRETKPVPLLHFGSPRVGLFARDQTVRTGHARKVVFVVQCRRSLAEKWKTYFYFRFRARSLLNFFLPSVDNISCTERSGFPKFFIIVLNIV